MELKSSENPSKIIENSLENLQFIAAKIQCHIQLLEKFNSGEFVPKMKQKMIMNV